MICVFGVFKVDGMYLIKCGVFNSAEKATAEAVYFEEHGQGAFIVKKIK